jgi:hypothetical protein
MMKRSLSALSLVGILLLAAQGCSGSGSAPTIKGSVTLDGKPLADAEVRFVPEGDSKTSVNQGNTAKTDASGSFQVEPNRVSRMTLKPGKYRVFISKQVDKSGKVPSPEDVGQTVSDTGGPGVGLKEAVPAKYSGANSQLTAEIKPGDNTLPPFELKSR